MHEAYLDLLKRTVTNFTALGGDDAFENFNSLKYIDPATRTWAIDHLARPMTLLRRSQLDLIERLVRDLEQREVPGDYIEAGVWRGGAIIFMRGLIEALQIPDRVVVAADSFAGIPKNIVFKHDPVDNWPERWDASKAEVQANIARFGLLDDRIEFLAGPFDTSLQNLAGRSFALVRLDSDAHDSVMASLEHLYPLLSPGGAIIIDDWHLVGCRFAVEAYRRLHAITDPIEVCDGNGFWIKCGT